MKKLNIGDKVKITKQAINWFFTHSYESHMVAGKVDEVGYNAEILALLEHCLGEPAVIVQENWAGTPEYNYRIKVGKWQTNMGPKDLRRLKS